MFRSKSKPSNKELPSDKDEYAINEKDILEIKKYQFEMMQMMKNVQQQVRVMSDRVEKMEELLVESHERESRMLKSNESFLPNESFTGTVTTGEKDSSKNAVFEKKKRQAVFAASTGDEENTVVKKIPKGADIAYLIGREMKSNILFDACSDEEINELIAAFGPVEIESGKDVVTQGEEGNHFYVLEEGVLDVVINNKTKKALEAPCSFGEIALMFNCVRSATVRANGPCKCWSIHQKDFRAITGKSKVKKLEEKSKLLKQVKLGGKLLSELLDPSDINAMAFTSREATFRTGEDIIKEGEKGDTFYIIEEGEVSIFLKDCGDKPLRTLTKGNFFGEKALLSDDVRTATCTATSDVKCLFLMRDDFIVMFGDMQELLDKSYNTPEASADQAQDLLVPIPGSRRSVPRNEPNAKLQKGDLVIVRSLGAGSFSKVVLVKFNPPADSAAPNAFPIGKLFALKCISRAKIVKDNLAKWIRNERVIMSMLDNPFIVYFYQEIRSESCLYFVMEALLGGDLHDLFRRKKKFQEEWTRFYVGSILLAFEDLHSRKIAFRDLKPENLVMDSKGYCKLVDFGFAKLITGGKTFTFCGTPDYLAPEMILSKGHDYAVDYWALGVLMYELTAGVTPFCDHSQVKMYKKIIAARLKPYAATPALHKVVTSLLTLNQSKRMGRIKGGTRTVMELEWFHGFDWNSLMSLKMPPPYVPEVKND